VRVYIPARRIFIGRAQNEANASFGALSQKCQQLKSFDKFNLIVVAILVTAGSPKVYIFVIRYYRLRRCVFLPELSLWLCDILATVLWIVISVMIVMGIVIDT
jgi:hypothetical protein